MPPIPRRTTGCHDWRPTATTAVSTRSTSSTAPVQVVTVQDLRTALLPKPFGKLYPRDLEIVQDQTWTLVDGELHGTVRIEARGAPGSGRSSVVLAPAGDASQLRCTATVKVDVRFVGGTIEGMLSRQMVDDTPEMLRFTTEWLNEQA